MNKELSSCDPCHPRFWDSQGPAVLYTGADIEETKSLHRCLLDNNLEDAVVFTSSGSTGVPKLTVLRRDALLASARMIVDWLGITKYDRMLRALPVYHVGGFGLICRARVSGAALLHHDEKWNPDAFVAMLKKEKISVISLVPTQVFDLVKCGHRAPDCLRIAVIGGGKLAHDIESEARHLGWPLTTSFGMTETASQIATEHPKLRPYAPGWLPVIYPWEVSTLNCGLLRLRGPALFSGRVERSPVGTWTFVKAETEDGWYTTSDFADIETDPSGQAWLKPRGRSDDSIKIRGELVSLSNMQSELEGLARAHGIHPSHVAIIDLPDERNGVQLALAIESAFEWELDALFDAFNLRAPAFAKLEKKFCMENLPRSPLGKLRRAALRQFLLNPQASKNCLEAFVED